MDITKLDANLDANFTVILQRRLRVLLKTRNASTSQVNERTITTTLVSSAPVSSYFSGKSKITKKKGKKPFKMTCRKMPIKSTPTTAIKKITSPITKELRGGDAGPINHQHEHHGHDHQHEYHGHDHQHHPHDHQHEYHGHNHQHEYHGHVNSNIDQYVPNNYLSTQSSYHYVNNTIHHLPNYSEPLSSSSHNVDQNIEPTLSPNQSPQSQQTTEEKTSSSRSKRSPNPLPRHKRESHINAEYRRRSKIQTGFDTLKVMVPGLGSEFGDQHNESKSAMLTTAAEYCRELKTQCEINEQREQALKNEIRTLELEIRQCQTDLPVSGVSSMDRASGRLDRKFKEYLQTNIALNWKFWIFGFLAKPLFESFKTNVSTTSIPVFLHSVKTWTVEKLQPNELRKEVIRLLKHISSNTSIMTSPLLLPQQAYQNSLQE